jgi:RsiW-degrading membrane proteinase PrsW (M82 family)
VPLTIAFLLSFIPAYLYACLLYWLDRYEREPWPLLGGAFVWGAVVAAGASYVLNTVFGVGVYLMTNSEGWTDIAVSSISAPLVEETLKAFAVLIVFIVFSKEFDSVVDGLLYASVTALGFAATENVFYLYESGYLEQGWQGMWFLFWLRVVLGAWGHPFYTAFTGIGLALARMNRSRLVKLLAPLLGWGLAVFVHFLHNTLAVFATDLESLVLVYVVDWSGWLLMALVGLAALLRERSWIRSQLLEEVNNGLITQAQYHIATSRLRRSRAQWRSHGRSQKQLTKRFYTLCTELAFKKQQYLRVGETQSNPMELIEQMRAELRELSPQV